MLVACCWTTATAFSRRNSSRSMYCRLITSWLLEPFPEDEAVEEVGLVCACAEARADEEDEVTGVLAFTIGVRLGSDLGPGCKVRGFWIVI